MRRRACYAAGALFGLAIACLVAVVCESADAAERKRLFQRNDPSTPSVKSAPQAAGGPLVGRLRERVLFASVRSRAVERLQKDGFKLVGGDPTPLSKEKAEALVDRLDEETIRGVVAEASPKTAAAAGEGGPLARLIEWIRTHPEEFQAILKLILSLLMLFADGPAAPA
jgi:hypothetical protein